MKKADLSCVSFHDMCHLEAKIVVLQVTTFDFLGSIILFSDPRFEHAILSNQKNTEQGMNQSTA